MSINKRVDSSHCKAVTKKIIIRSTKDIVIKLLRRRQTSYHMSILHIHLLRVAVGSRKGCWSILLHQFGEGCLELFFQLDFLGQVLPRLSKTLFCSCERISFSLSASNSSTPFTPVSSFLQKRKTSPCSKRKILTRNGLHLSFASVTSNNKASKA